MSDTAKIIGTTLLWLGLVAGAYYYTKPVPPCTEPIRYSLGAVDAQFGLSEAEFAADIARAEAIWEKAIGRDLFVYDPEGKLSVSLTYDIRQKLTDKERLLSAGIDEKKETADSIRQQYSALRADYQAKAEAYARAVESYNARQRAYNERVEFWNSKGGAPPTEYQKLNDERAALENERAALEEERVALSALVERVNAFIDRYNLLVARITSDINEINNDGLAGTQFEEGLYSRDASGERITVYQYEDKIDLIRVLAHEFGHALGLDHNGNAVSIMNPVNQSDTLTLSPEDLRDLKARCGIE
jgi:hypothetical protein